MRASLVPHALPRLLPLAVAAALAGTVEARATEYCAVRESPDGFVALRSGPGTQFPVVARMKADDEVRLLPGAKGSWLAVQHWWGNDRLDHNKRDGFRRGFVHKRYVGDCG